MRGPYSRLFAPQVQNHGPELPPGTLDGFPVLDAMGNPAKPALLKQEEYEDLALAGRYHAELFTLPEQLEQYAKVKDAVVKGKCKKEFEDRHFDPTTKTFTVLLSWVELYAEAPKAASR